MQMPEAMTKPRFWRLLVFVDGEVRLFLMIHQAFPRLAGEQKPRTGATFKNKVDAFILACHPPKYAVVPEKWKIPSNDEKGPETGPFSVAWGVLKLRRVEHVSKNGAAPFEYILIIKKKSWKFVNIQWTKFEILGIKNSANFQTNVLYFSGFYGIL